MLKIYCMFDNHTFATVRATDREGIAARVKELIRLKKGASFFVRDGSDASMECLSWHSRDDLSKLDEWLDRVMEELAFAKLMVA